MDLAQVLIRVVPISVAAALSPFNVSVVILMLLSKDHPIARALAYVAGFVVSLLFIGTIALSIIAAFYAPPLRARAYILIAGVGVLLLLLGTRQLITQTDPDQPPASWLKHIAQLRPFTAFWVGFFLSTVGLKTLGIYVACVGVITTAGLGPVALAFAFVIVLFIIISTMLVPVIVYLADPQRGKEILTRMRDWMEQKQHRIAGSILIIVGVALLFVGIQGLP